ncbi:hypothetical protein [Pelagicoccus mobilis]|uniref:Lipoprotein n=1 Tax=Pelagicoccus mobilis TaxID=415221 RepID=A0A934S083_9BACT|nr:hypothetical protein [Pelagicoccus mobilis]MBK1877074.1 hypothetical protein [Pelagicoccus mobilis]
MRSLFLVFVLFTFGCSEKNEAARLQIAYLSMQYPESWWTTTSWRDIEPLEPEPSGEDALVGIFAASPDDPNEVDVNFSSGIVAEIRTIPDFMYFDERMYLSLYLNYDTEFVYSEGDIKAARFGDLSGYSVPISHGYGDLTGMIFVSKQKASFVLLYCYYYDEEGKAKIYERLNTLKLHPWSEL